MWDNVQNMWRKLAFAENRTYFISLQHVESEHQLTLVKWINLEGWNATLVESIVQAHRSEGGIRCLCRVDSLDLSYDDPSGYIETVNDRPDRARPP